MLIALAAQCNLVGHHSNCNTFFDRIREDIPPSCAWLISSQESYIDVTIVEGQMIDMVFSSRPDLAEIQAELILHGCMN